MGARISAGWEGRSTAVLMGPALIGGCLLAVVTLWPHVASAQGASSQDQNANAGNDLFRPPPNLFQMMYDYKTAPGSGSAPGTMRDVTTDMAVAREETFGPVAPLFRFHTEAEAIALAHATEYGLAAYFYGRDIGRVWRVAEALEYGIVGINTGLIYPCCDRSDRATP